MSVVQLSPFCFLFAFLQSLIIFIIMVSDVFITLILINIFKGFLRLFPGMAIKHFNQTFIVKLYTSLYDFLKFGLYCNYRVWCNYLMVVFDYFGMSTAVGVPVSQRLGGRLATTLRGHYKQHNFLFFFFGTSVRNSNWLHLVSRLATTLVAILFLFMVRPRTILKSVSGSVGLSVSTKMSKQAIFV